MGLFWEIYGLSADEPFRVSVRIGEVRGGFLSRIARAMTFTKRDEVTVEWQDRADNANGVVARTITVDLENIKAGEQDIEVTIEVGGEPVARRVVRVRVTEAPAG